MTEREIVLEEVKNQYQEQAEAFINAEVQRRDDLRRVEIEFELNRRLAV